jgi:hypothetical protein
MDDKKTDKPTVDQAVADIEQHNHADPANPKATTQPKDPLAGSNRLKTREDYLIQYDDDRPKKRHRFLRFLGWMLLIVVLTGAIGGSVWYFALRKVPKEETKPQGNSGAIVNDTEKPAVKEDPTEVYNATAFNMQFDYPQDWKVANGANNTVVASSPATKLKLASGKTQTGQINLTVQHKQSSLPEFQKGNALAVRESQKINYKKPSQVQRASTYLSFLNYSESTSKGIDGVYITGDFGYVKDQYVAQDDVAKADPLIRLTFRGCNDDKCATVGDPVTLAPTAWDDTTFTKPLQTMLESIVVQ